MGLGMALLTELKTRASDLKIQIGGPRPTIFSYRRYVYADTRVFDAGDFRGEDFRVDHKR